jgi:hypothetical protein
MQTLNREETRSSEMLDRTYNSTKCVKAHDKSVDFVSL